MPSNIIIIDLSSDLLNSKLHSLDIPTVVTITDIYMLALYCVLALKNDPTIVPMDLIVQEIHHLLKVELAMDEYADEAYIVDALVDITYQSYLTILQCIENSLSGGNVYSLNPAITKGNMLMLSYDR